MTGQLHRLFRVSYQLWVITGTTRFTRCRTCRAHAGVGSAGRSRPNCQNSKFSCLQRTASARRATSTTSSSHGPLLGGSVPSSLPGGSPKSPAMTVRMQLNPRCWSAFLPLKPTFAAKCSLWEVGSGDSFPALFHQSSSVVVRRPAVRRCGGKRAGRTPARQPWQGAFVDIGGQNRERHLPALQTTIPSDPSADRRNSKDAI